MGHWAVIISDERHEAERLFHHDTLELTGVDGPHPQPGDQILIVAGQAAPAVVALGMVRPEPSGRGPASAAPRPAPPEGARVVSDGASGGVAPGVSPSTPPAASERASAVSEGAPRGVEPVASDSAPLVVTYTRRLFDEPVPVERLVLDGPVTPVDAETFQAISGRLQPAADRTTWMVSLDLPIEAPSPAEAVRLFWSYVMELGPRELPAFVSPAGDELAMQAFVLGEQANLDPEEEDED